MQERFNKWRFVPYGAALLLVGMAAGAVWSWKSPHLFFAYFQWESGRGFHALRVEDDQGGRWHPAGGRVWQYLVTAQLKERLDSCLGAYGWTKIKGPVDVTITRVVPVVVSTCESDERFEDPDVNPLMDAAWYGDVEKVERLLAAGTDVNTKDQKGQTALIYAAASAKSRIEAFRALIDAGADVNTRTKGGRTPLLLVAAKGTVVREESREELRALLNAHADVNAASKSGSTPLLEAVKECDAETTRVLLSAAADPNARLITGESVLSLARERQHHDVRLWTQQDWNDIINQLTKAGARD